MCITTFKTPFCRAGDGAGLNISFWFKLMLYPNGFDDTWNNLNCMQLSYSTVDIETRKGLDKFLEVASDEPESVHYKVCAG